MEVRGTKDVRMVAWSFGCQADSCVSLFDVHWRKFLEIRGVYITARRKSHYRATSSAVSRSLECEEKQTSIILDQAKLRVQPRGKNGGSEKH